MEHALAHLEEASIGTIHSFCAQILRERPVEAVVDPAFEELSEQQSSRIYERAFRAWIQAKLAEGAPALRRALVRLAARSSGVPATPVVESSGIPVAPSFVSDMEPTNLPRSPAHRGSIGRLLGSERENLETVRQEKNEQAWGT